MTGSNVGGKMMKNAILIAALLVFSASGFAGDMPYVRAERASAVYKVGEEIVFLVKDAGTGATYTIDNGVKVTASAPLTAEPIKVKAENPGFVLVSVHCGNNEKNKPVLTHAGAAIEPDKILRERCVRRILTLSGISSWLCSMLCR